MNTPDAGLIRVRWYAVNAVGVVPLTDYSSSDWDADPKDNDPQFGEQSTLRNPFTDWRDCCPPPWPDPAITSCPNAYGPQFNFYSVNPLGFDGYAPGIVLNGPSTMDWSSGCLWRTAAFLVHPEIPVWSLVFNDDGSASLFGGRNVDGLSAGLCEYRAAAPVDPGQPFVAFSYYVDPRLTSSPSSIRVKGFGNDHLLDVPCQWIVDEGGLFLITES